MKRGKNDVAWPGLARPVQNWTGWRVVSRQHQLGLVIKKKKNVKWAGLRPAGGQVGQRTVARTGEEEDSER